MIQALKNIFKLDDEEKVYWKDLQRANEGDWVDLETGDVVEKPFSGGVFFKRMPTSISNQMMFITRIYKNSKGYHTHLHPDALERCMAMFGTFTVDGNNTPKTFASFFRNTKHSVHCSQDIEEDYCDIMVEFVYMKN